MLKILNKRLKRLYHRLRWPIRRHRSSSKVVIKKFGKSTMASTKESSSTATVHPNHLDNNKPIRIATFNAASFSMAPTLPKLLQNQSCSRTLDYPKSILKQSPRHSNSVNENLSKQEKFAKSKLRVSINLPDNEISSLLRNWQLMSSSKQDDDEKRVSRGKGPLRSSVSFGRDRDDQNAIINSSKSILEVLRELDADVLALQDVKAEEEKEMKPLSDLADALGMKYVFADSWAPEYGNAVLSKWPIKRWKTQKIFDDTDFRNVLKVTIDVPETGEMNLYCTHLDHLDENWRMKQINAIIKSNEGPHILAGGLNSLDQTDYSSERWTDIVKYYEEMGKPTPKVEVMKFLKSKQYIDAKDSAGEYEPVVMIAKGQSVQGTCKYGTRLDYILASPDSPYKFVPGSYSVFSSKGTSDHHIVKVDIIKVHDHNSNSIPQKNVTRKRKVVKITTSSSPSKGLWTTHTHNRDKLTLA